MSATYRCSTTTVGQYGWNPLSWPMCSSTHARPASESGRSKYTVPPPSTMKSDCDAGGLAGNASGAIFSPWWSASSLGATGTASSGSRSVAAAFEKQTLDALNFCVAIAASNQVAWLGAVPVFKHRAVPLTAYFFFDSSNSLSMTRRTHSASDRPFLDARFSAACF